MTNAQTPDAVLLFVGGAGEWLPSVPARDLTQQDAIEYDLDLDDLARNTRLYEYADPAKHAALIAERAAAAVPAAEPPPSASEVAALAGGAPTAPDGVSSAAPTDGAATSGLTGGITPPETNDSPAAGDAPATAAPSAGGN